MLAQAIEAEVAEFLAGHADKRDAAGRTRLVRQLLTETTMLFLLGGAGGLMLARVMTSLIVSRLPAPPALPFPVDISIALDGGAVLFTMLLSLLAAVLAGVVPALQASKTDVVSALKDEGQGVVGFQPRAGRC